MTNGPTNRPAYLPAGILLATAGLLLTIRYGGVGTTGWPHWLHHVIHATIAAAAVAGTWLLAAPGRRLPRVAAALFAVWALGEAVVGAAAVVREAILSGGALPAGLHAVEYVLYLAYIGVLLLGVDLVRRRGIPRAAGGILLAALLVDLAGVPWGAGAGLAVAGVLLTVAARRAVQTAPAVAV